jgi:hypothetical protein
VTETATAMADGNATKTAVAMVNGNCNGNGRRRWQRRWATATAMVTESATMTEMVTEILMVTATASGEGDNDKGRVASSCASNVQRYGSRGNTLPPPPWTQRKVHSPVLCHEGDTAKSVSSLSRGRVPDSSPWILFLFIIYNYCSVY